MTTLLPDGRSLMLLRPSGAGRNTDGSRTRASTYTELTIPPDPDGPLPAFAPAGSTETIGGQDTVTQQDTLYLPTGTDVQATDVVLIDGSLATGQPDGGELYQVDGRPSVWVSPFPGNWAPGIAATLQRITG